MDDWPHVPQNIKRHITTNIPNMRSRRERKACWVSSALITAVDNKTPQDKQHLADVGSLPCNYSTGYFLSPPGFAAPGGTGPFEVCCWTGRGAKS